MEILDAVFGVLDVADGLSSPKRQRETIIGLALAVIIGVVMLVVYALLKH